MSCMLLILNHGCRISLKNQDFILLPFFKCKILDSNVFKHFNGVDPNPLHAFPMHVVIVSSVLKFLNYWN